MNNQKFSSRLLMPLLCILPLLIFLALALAGVRFHPLLVPLILIACCLAMSYLMAGTCGHRHSEPKPDLEDPPAPFQQEVKIDDVFRVSHTRQAGAAMVFEGELLKPPEEAYDILKQRFQNAGATPLLQEGKDARPLLVLVPGELRPPEGKERGPWLNLALIVLTFLTTTWAGALHSGVNLWNEPGKFAVGLPYSLALIVILGAHELGHYFTARAYGMKVTLPYFIPVPFGLGTFGAFIQLKSPADHRRALFDVGVAGPLAGLVFAIPALWIGLRYSTFISEDVADKMHGGTSIGSSFLLALIAKLSLGDALTEGHLVLLHPMAFAGWLGLLVTALNLLPIGQLDGGHMADAMFGRSLGATIGTVAMFGLFVMGLFVWSGLLTWAFIVYFIAGGKGIPPLNDVSRLGPFRLAVGAFAFLLLFLILSPVPHRFYESLSIHCPYL